jgi:hypothetical protein
LHQFHLSSSVWLFLHPGGHQGLGHSLKLGY